MTSVSGDPTHRLRERNGASLQDLKKESAIAIQTSGQTRLGISVCGFIAYSKHLAQVTRNATVADISQCQQLQQLFSLVEVGEQGGIVSFGGV